MPSGKVVWPGAAIAQQSSAPAASGPIDLLSTPKCLGGGAPHPRRADPCSFGAKQPRVRDLGWFDRAYASRLGRRYATFRAAFASLLERNAQPTIVETGCVREKNDYSAGYSTVLFGELLRHSGGRLFTVDLSAKNIALCRRLTRRYADLIEYNIGDSVEFLRAWDLAHSGVAIDLLYLDSFDYPLADDPAGRAASQLHCRNELDAALPALAANALVLIDDDDLPGGGKPLLAKRRLAELGWTCLLDDYQTLWRAPTVTGPAASSSAD